MTIEELETFLKEDGYYINQSNNSYNKTCDRFFIHIKVCDDFIDILAICNTFRVTKSTSLKYLTKEELINIVDKLKEIITLYNSL